MTKRLFLFIVLTVGFLSYRNVCAANEINRLELQREITIEKGTAEIVFPILLVNSNEITGFQCDLVLSEFFSLATDENGEKKIELSRTTSERHVCETNTMVDGSLRIVCSSFPHASFEGHDGAVLNVTISVSDKVTSGVFLLSLKNIVMTDANATRYSSGDVFCSVILSLPGDVNGDGEVNITDITHIIDKINNQSADDFNERAADLNGDGEINITDVTLLLDIINSVK